MTGNPPIMPHAVSGKTHPAGTRAAHPQARLAATDGASLRPIPLEVMRKRAEFVRTAKGKRVHRPGFLLQARKVDDGGADAGATIRVGFTASKRVGNAVMRNRAKRRLRALARNVLPLHGRPGWAYVLIAKAGTTGSMPFADLERDLISALRRVHGDERANGDKARGGGNG